MRYAAHKDDNHKEIVRGLRATLGSAVSILELEGRRPGVPDLLVGYAKRNTLLEIKRPDNDLTDDQAQWHEQWKGDTPWVVENTREALIAIGAWPPPSPNVAPVK